MYGSVEDDSLTSHINQKINEWFRKRDLICSADDDLLICKINKKVEEGRNTNTPIELTYIGDDADINDGQQQKPSVELLAAKYGDGRPYRKNQIVLAIKILEGKNEGYGKYVPIDHVSGKLLVDILKAGPGPDT